MSLREPALLTLLTDFGTADWYVAAVKGTVLRLAPGARLVDITHEVPPGDIETAAFHLAAAAPSFPAGTVHLAVVDPGVGSSRRLLAVAHPASPETCYLAPDNGLLTPFLTAGAQVRSVERPDLDLPAPGSTFHGRDRFAPAAAALLRGEPFDALGPEVADPVALPRRPPRRDGARLSGRVIHIDRYGNLVTDLPAAWLPPGTPFRAEVAGRSTTVRITHYRELAAHPAGTAGVLPGSLGTLELSLDGDSLARSWQARRGAEVRVTLGWSGGSGEVSST